MRRARSRCDDCFDLRHSLPYLSSCLTQLGQRELHRGAARSERILGRDHDRVNTLDGLLDLLRGTCQGWSAAATTTPMKSRRRISSNR